MVAARAPTGITPAKAMVMNTRECSPWPITVDPMSRAHSQRPWVATFIFARTAALANSPTRYARNDAPRSRGVYPSMRAYAGCASQNGAAGKTCPIQMAVTASRLQRNPNQMTRRACA